MMKNMKDIVCLTMWVIGQQRSDDVGWLRESSGVFSKHSVIVLGSVFQTRHLKGKVKSYSAKLK